jgi:hypothetical protein
MYDKNYIPSRTSPKGDRRGCLCWETSTYSLKCCDGSVRAQGIGNITGTIILPDIDFSTTEWQIITSPTWEAVTDTWN